jgi:hypothetical protein
MAEFKDQLQLLDDKTGLLWEPSFTANVDDPEAFIESLPENLRKYNIVRW